MAIMNDVGVLLIQETKFNKNYTDGEISMSGFSVASRCDRFGGLGGGSIIYVRDDIKYHGSKSHNLDLNVPFKSQKQEYWIILSSTFIEPRIPPRRKKIDFIRDNGSKRVILSGDINLSPVHWDRPDFELAITHKHRVVYAAIKDSGWVQQIKEKTRLPKLSENNYNILDLVLTSEADYIHGDVELVPNMFPKGFTDQKLILFIT